MRKQPAKPLLSDYKVAALATVIVIVGVCMRLYGLNSQGLHCEELFTIPAATGQHYVYLKSETALRLESFPTTRQEYTSLVTPKPDRGLREVTQVIGQNVHMPVYFYLMHYWIKFFGVSEWSLRLPSVIFGTVSILMMFLLARELFNTFTTLIASLLVALMPEQIFYSQEARMYSLLVLLSISSTYFLLLARKHPSSHSFHIFYSVTTLAGLYTHYGFIFCFAFQAVFVWIESLFQKERKLQWKWLIIQVSITATVLPWLLVGLSQKQASHEMLAWARARPSFESVLSSVASSLTSMISVPEIPFGWLSVAVAYLLVLLGILWLRSQRDVLLLLALWVALPVVGIVFLDVILGTKAIGVLRYWMVITPALYLLMAAGLDKLMSIRVSHRRPISIGILSTVVLFLLVVAAWTASGTLRPKPDRYRELAVVVEKYTVAQKKDAIFTEGSNAIALALGYYSRRDIKLLRAAYVMDRLKTQTIGEIFESSDIWLAVSGESTAKVYLERNGYRLVNQPVKFGHITLYAYKAPPGDAPQSNTK